MYSAVTTGMQACMMLKTHSNVFTAVLSAGFPCMCHVKIPSEFLKTFWLLKIKKSYRLHKLEKKKKHMYLRVWAFPLLTQLPSKTRRDSSSVCFHTCVGRNPILIKHNGVVGWSGDPCGNPTLGLLSRQLGLWSSLKPCTGKHVPADNTWYGLNWTTTR